MTDKIKTIVADDEPFARRNLKTAISDFPEIEIVAECANGIEAIHAILEHEPDLLFLDIEMPEMDGLEVLNTLGTANMPFVIFVTAYDKYAIEAFEKHAFDYLLKPFSPERFQEAVSRTIRSITSKNKQQSTELILQTLQEFHPQRKYVNRLAIRSAARIFFLNVDEIGWIESAGNYVDIHAGKHTHLLRETMTRMEAKLDPSLFLRIHRSYIVNIDKIAEIQPDGYDFIVLLIDGKTLPMGRKFRDKLSEIIEMHF